jgi:DNA polymerase I-like protein with 3'-5' exonuclease and polymerase domains
METYFKTFPQLSEFFKQSGQNALKFNYVRALFWKSEIL